LSPVGFSRTAVNRIKIPIKESSFDRVRKSVRNHKGEPFNTIDYPWTRGICETWDDPTVRTITLDFAARIGKTQLAQSLIISELSQDPATWMYGNANEGLVKETVRDKYYPMFERCRHTRGLVPKPAKRTQTRIDLATCRGYCAWSGSPITMADKDPKYLHAGEVDKWSKSKSSEADPLPLFLERGLEIPDRKALIESTPSITNQSRIERYLHRGWNCRFHVPCPNKKCGHYQELVMGNGAPGTGGIVFDKLDGKLNERLAYETARYRCCKCNKEWGDDERRPAIQSGVWCPEGMYVTKNGKLRGQMLNPGPDASFQISRIYAPTFNFGDIAKAFVKAKLGSEEEMRNFLNSWLSLTWFPVSIEREWDEVAELLCMDYELHEIPKECSFVTMAVDVQIDHWVFMVVAWKSDQSGYVIDYGIRNSWDEITEVINSRYKHRDGGPDMGPIITLIDARDGNRTDEVVTYCKSVNQEKAGPWVWPCMGSKAGQMSGSSYKKSSTNDAGNRGKGVRKTKKLMFGWITVNTNYWQQWIHNCLYKRQGGEPMSLAFPKIAKEDEDLWSQMMNEAPDVSQDSTGHDNIRWVVVHEHIAIDLRDCARYVRCAAEVYTNTNWARIPKQRRLSTVTPPRKAQAKQPDPPPKESSNKPTKRTRTGWVRGLTRSRLGKKQ